jgi:lipopolysaccharide export system protein LptA
MYFDAEAGVLVYLKNVTVTDPRFTLTGADELKVFFAKKDPKKITPSDKKNEQKKESSSSEPNKAEGEKKETVKKPETIGPAANFGDVQKLIASGTVRLVQKGVAGKDPVEASGGLLTYDVPKGEIIISQRYPWVKQGSFFARAKQPNLTLRLLNSGSFTTQGEWEMGGNLKLNDR